jgi:hypothetical protein
MVSTVTVYYVERNFTSDNFGEYNGVDETLQAEYDAAREAACADPSEINLAILNQLETRMSLESSFTQFYYKDAKTVLVVGSSSMPAWIGTDIENSRLIHIDEDVDENVQYGNFELEWSPLGMREGDYFICWTWYPNIGGSSLTSHLYFSLGGSTQLTTSIPTHFTQPKKYETLLDRYLPEMFKTTLCNGDLTPKVLSEFDMAIAKGFTFLEDMANQMVDLLDANATHESFLPALASMFNLKLRSQDPTRWRRQIKNSVPLFKKKGTLIGLTEALAETGIILNSFVRLWQVISSYTWQELLDITENGQDTFDLSQLALLPIDTSNFELYYRGVNDTEWTTMASTNVSISEVDGVTVVTWLGSPLVVGDSLRIVYQTNIITTPQEQLIEIYIRSLPIADQRDERDQIYPLKNWNVRVIEENDPYFDVVIPTRHPYYDPLVFGWVRTEFPYSENIYNMDEYNGSVRDSLNPCDIDREFIDYCHGGQSSLFNIDLEIEELCEDRISEAREIVEEYVPFHAIPHTISISGAVNDFVSSGQEEIQGLITVHGEETTISGNGQMIFNRVMAEGCQILRDELATATVEVTTTDMAYNDEVVLFSPDNKLDEIGLSVSNVLEILSPGPPWVTQPEINVGIYSLSDVQGNYGVVSGSIPLPVDNRSFAYRLSNDFYSNSDTTIFQEFVFNDDNISFVDLWNDETPENAYDGSWTLVLAGYPYTGDNVYEVISMDIDGNLRLDNFLKIGCTLPSTDTTGINYILKDDSGNTIASGATGEWTETTRGLVDISSEVSLDDVMNIIKIGNYVLYNGLQYRVDAFLDMHRFYISKYTDGTASSILIHVYDRLIDTAIGYFNYRGMTLETIVNYETALSISNGKNSTIPEDLLKDDNNFKENFLIMITISGTDYYYAISDIDNTIITLNGPYQTWGLSSEILAPNVSFQIIKYAKNGPVDIAPRIAPVWPGHEFRFLDRRGNEVIQVHNSETDEITGLAMATALNQDQSKDVVSQKENISLKITWFDQEKK